MRFCVLMVTFQSLFRGANQLQIPDELSTDSLDRAWNALLRAIDYRYVLLEQKMGSQGSMSDLLRRLQLGIGLTNEKLDGKEGVDCWHNYC